MDPASLLRRGAALHQAGQFPQAEALYRQVLAANPNQPDALHLLGVLAHQTGHHQPAESLIRHALIHAPKAAPMHSSHGHVLRALQRPAEAETAYRAALRLQPNLPDFHHHLALALRDQGNTEAAETAFRQAIRLHRDHIPARLDLANLLNETARYTEAEACLRAALRTAPANHQLLNALGLAQIGQNRLEEALKSLDEALAIAPDYTNAAINRANCLAQLNRPQEAAAAYAPLAQAAPHDADLVINYARTLIALDQPAQAVAPLQRLLEAAPGNGLAWHVLAQAYAQQDRPDLTLPCLQRVTELMPENADAWFELGMAYRDTGNWQAAIAPHERAVQLNPENADYRSCYAYALLANGDFARGWPEFKWRTRKPGNLKLIEPEWDGTPTTKTVIIHVEQGIGDSIQFARFIPQAATRARVVIACPTSLTKLLRGLPNVAEVADGKPVPPYDLHTPLMSLPALLEIPPERFAETIPYFHADPAQTEIWRHRLAHLQGPKIGLVWAGNPKYPVDRKRSLPFTTLAPLLELPGLSFISLQMGEAAAQAANAPLFNAAPLISDYADTAALIMALDLVISVDTSVAHLAGALGHPIWMLNRADTDWRWLLDRADSPWYPTMKIFRQPTPGDWTTVIENVTKKLRKESTSF
jgi:tetratricopeptide (TPR) repeat protein